MWGVSSLTSDPIEMKVLEMLYDIDRARFSEILSCLLKPFQKRYNRNSLAVTLTRKLKRLEEERLVKKTVEGHKRVYYSLTKNSRIFLNKELEWFHNLLDKPSGFTESNETTESLLLSLSVIPQAILEILADLYSYGPVPSRMLKNTSQELEGYISKLLQSFINELISRQEKGENLKEIFKKTSTWRFTCTTKPSD